MTCQVVDGVLEEIRLGMEINNPEMSQRRISSVKFLGEVCGLCLVAAPWILNRDVRVSV